ncbi:MAG: glutathione S-transferase [Kordiimonas sp.]|nr:glutathione S-transferase [Kordiimonas sp.]
MRTVYHHWFSPFSRKVRIALSEKAIDADLVVEKTWNRRTDFLRLNPAGTVPVMIEENGLILVDSYAICEYLEETAPEIPLLGQTPEERAEVRRLVSWFDVKCYEEVTRLLINEKVLKRFLKMGTPDSDAIRCAAHNIRHHLGYIQYLTERRNWLAGHNFSYADIAAASHLSCIDYLGDVPWQNFEGAKDWYMRIKSRPSLRPILKDNIAGFPPAPHYSNLDF